MKTKFLMFNSRVLVLMFVLLCVYVENLRADEDCSITYGSSLTHNTTAGSDEIGDYFTATWTKSPGPNDPVYWNSKSTYGVKMYATKSSTNGNTLTISTDEDGIFITGITITGQSAQGTTALYWNGTANNTGTSKTFDEEDEIQSVTINLKETGGSKNGQYIVKTIAITYVETTTTTCTANPSVAVASLNGSII